MATPMKSSRHSYQLVGALTPTPIKRTPLGHRRTEDHAEADTMSSSLSLFTTSTRDVTYMLSRDRPQLSSQISSSVQRQMDLIRKEGSATGRASRTPTSLKNSDKLAKIRSHAQNKPTSLENEATLKGNRDSAFPSMQIDSVRKALPFAFLAFLPPISQLLFWQKTTSGLEEKIASLKYMNGVCGRALLVGSALFFFATSHTPPPPTTLPPLPRMPLP